jgi:hypothetical protein
LTPNERNRSSQPAHLFAKYPLPIEWCARQGVLQWASHRLHGYFWRLTFSLKQMSRAWVLIHTPMKSGQDGEILPFSGPGTRRK